jgi:hypothetical protein
MSALRAGGAFVRVGGLGAALLGVARHAADARVGVDEAALAARLFPDLVVLDGPFAGLRFASLDPHCSALLPKLTGTYELELRPFWREVADVPFRTIVDVGCAEGYYAVGLAVNYSDAAVIAFDESPRARALCRAMIELNGVLSRVDLRGRCDENRLLATAIASPSLLISDCEGFESELFTSRVCDHLAQCHIVIETHDAIVPGSSAGIIRRLSSTHDVQEVPMLADRDRIDAIPARITGSLNDASRYRVIREDRLGPQSWLIARPRGHRASSSMAG